jgi:hypothetical protein
VFSKSPNPHGALGLLFVLVASLVERKFTVCPAYSGFDNILAPWWNSSSTVRRIVPLLITDPDFAHVPAGLSTAHLARF